MDRDAARDRAEAGVRDAGSDSVVGDCLQALDLLDRCEAMLKEVEWEGGFRRCPVCDASQRYLTHHQSCNFAALLADLEGGDANR